MKAILTMSLMFVCFSRAAAQADPSDDFDTEQRGLLHSVSIGIRANAEREANSRDIEWGPTASLSVYSSTGTAATRFSYEIGYQYNDAFSKLESDEGASTTRVRTSE